MSDKYRVVVELYSDSNPNLVERKIIDDKSVEQVTSIYELGLRHTNQIELLQNIQRIIDEKYIQNIYMCKNNEYILYITT